MRVARALGAAICALLLPAARPVRAADGSSSWTPADTQRFIGVRDVEISPDGGEIVFTRTVSDLARNKNFRSISIVASAGGPVRILTEPDAGDSSPRFSPDGRRLAYLAEDAGGGGLWVMDADGSHKRRICAVQSSNQRYADEEEGAPLSWSPDGRWIAFVGADPSEAPQERDPLVIRGLMYQAYDDYFDGRKAQIWIVPSSGGAPRRLSDGRHVDLSPAWSPDGREIVFVSNREKDPDFRRNDDLWVAEVATGRIRRLTDTPGSEVAPAWSPDGKSIAYIATRRAWTTYDSIAEDFHAWVIPASGGEARELNASLDRRTESVAWAPDSRSVVFTAEDQGRRLPYRVSSDGGESRALIDENVWTGEPSVAARGGRIAFALASTTRPDEVAVLDPGTSRPRLLTKLNAAPLAALPVEDAETVWFPTTENNRVEAWLMKPRGMVPGRKYPLVLFIHGGPHGQFGYRFSPEYQMYADHGWTVLFMNPRGSSGYGQVFSDACLDNWGGVDYDDLMMGLDGVLSDPKFSFVDSDRMVVTGGSYGGFMTNWVVTHTARFRAAVTREGMSNLMTDQSLSDAWDLEVIEFGPPWSHMDTYLEWSPIKFIANARTPTMIIEGEQDHDVTIAEAEQMYAGLKLQGVETVLALYPREPHGFREPRHRVDAYERMMRWFEDHTRDSVHMDQRWDKDARSRQWSGTIPGAPR
jgi:dipeptidyl aminopeptidase/acylaminoacyl peptidase